MLAVGREGDNLLAALRNFEGFQLDLRPGALNREQPGGYRYVEQLFARKLVAVGASDAPPALKAAPCRRSPRAS